MNWRERIVRARGAKAFSEEDRRDAAVWNRCAVGEQSMNHPTVVLIEDMLTDEAESRTLHQLGIGFHLAVRNDCFVSAESFLDQIEDHVLILKREAVG